jgi:hypothetical protein
MFFVGAFKIAAVRYIFYMKSIEILRLTPNPSPLERGWG